jgi:hypothetical protein
MPTSRWFGEKDKTKENVPRTSADLQPTLTNVSRPQDTPPINFSSPHDAVLARMHGPAPGAPETSTIRDGVTIGGPSLDRLTPLGSYSTTENVPKELLYDPFNGTPLGVLIPLAEDGRSQHQQASTSRRVIKEEQWVHLSRVLDLQNEVARMHLDMEGIGSNDGKGKGGGRGRWAKGKSVTDAGARGTREREGSTTSGAKEELEQKHETGQPTGTEGPDEDEEGVDAAGDEEHETQKAREAQFASLSDRFAGRSEAIDEIMAKVRILRRESSGATYRSHTYSWMIFQRP